MRSATVARLKASLCEYLASVERGEEVVVTKRGRPIARISRIEREVSSDARRKDLIRRGVLRPRKERLSEETLRGLPIVQIPLETLLRVIDEEREDRV